MKPSGNNRSNSKSSGNINNNNKKKNIMQKTTKYWLIIGLIFVSINCHRSTGHIKTEEIKEDIFKLDTIALLTNKNLDYLTTEVENAELKESKSISDIPVFIFEALNNWAHDSFSIANPGEKWQVSDIVGYPYLPWRQLVYLGVGSNIMLMAYYRGGVGVSEKMVIVKYENEKIIDFWAGFTFKDPATKHEIIEVLKNYNSEIPRKIANTTFMFL